MTFKQKESIKKQSDSNPNYIFFSPTHSYNSSTGAESDCIARIQNGPKGMVAKYMMQSSTFENVIREQNNIKELLIKVAKNLWETHKYNQEYISFLLGGYTEEEFLELAEKVAEEPMKDMTEQQISFSLNFLSSIFKNNLSSSDLSILLNQDCSYIEKSLQKLKHPTISILS